MAILGFLIAAAYWPAFTSGSVARWIVLAAGLPFLSLDPRGVPALVKVSLALALSYAGLTLLWSPDPLDGFLSLFHLMLFAGVLFAASRLESIDRVMVAVGWGLAISAAICIAQSLGFTLGIPSDAEPSGLFVNRDFLAEAAAPVFVWAFLTKRITLSAAMCVPIALCGSRVAVLSVWPLLAAFGRFWPRRWPILAGVGRFWPLLAAFAAFTVFWDGKIVSLGERWTIWMSVLSDLNLWGNGIGWFAHAYPHYETAHSDILQGFGEIGFAAIALFTVPLYILWRAQGHRAERAALLAIVVQMAVAFPLHLPVGTFLAGLLAGHLARFVPRHGRIGIAGRNPGDGTLWADLAARSNRFPI